MKKLIYLCFTVLLLSSLNGCSEKVQKQPAHVYDLVIGQTLPEVDNVSFTLCDIYFNTMVKPPDAFLYYEKDVCETGWEYLTLVFEKHALDDKDIGSFSDWLGIDVTVDGVAKEEMLNDEDNNSRIQQQNSTIYCGVKVPVDSQDYLITLTYNNDIYNMEFQGKEEIPGRKIVNFNEPFQYHGAEFVLESARLTDKVIKWDGPVQQKLTPRNTTLEHILAINGSAANHGQETMEITEHNLNGLSLSEKGFGYGLNGYPLNSTGSNHGLSVKPGEVERIVYGTAISKTTEVKDVDLILVDGVNYYHINKVQLVELIEQEKNTDILDKIKCQGYFHNYIYFNPAMELNYQYSDQWELYNLQQEDQAAGQYINQEKLELLDQWEAVPLVYGERKDDSANSTIYIIPIAQFDTRTVRGILEQWRAQLYPESTQLNVEHLMSSEIYVIGDDFEYNGYAVGFIGLIFDKYIIIIEAQTI